MAKDNNGWDEYKRMILFSLEELQREVAVLREQHVKMQNDLNTFKAYLTVGVAFGTGILQLGIYFIDKLVFQ